MFESLKKRMGVETANCSTCEYLGTESDGNYPEMATCWPTCEKVDRYQYLKSFPFKREMPCWRPGFWMSKFPGVIKTGSDEEYSLAVKNYIAALNAIEHGHEHMWE